jgi:hypothetical protein
MYPGINPLNGRWLNPEDDHPYMLGLISEGDVKVANTPANGRWNSGGLGTAQANPDSTSVVITAAIEALGESFTFEQQNDPDSGYVYESQPDDRGTIYHYGALTQMRRGYVHRATNSSTGYRRWLRFDQRLRNQAPPCFNGDATGNPDTVNFGTVVVGHTAIDTAEVYFTWSHTLGAVYASYPFVATRVPPYYGQVFNIPVRFSPPHAGVFSGYLSVSAGDQFARVPIRGCGASSLAPDLDIVPNPFNLTTTFRFTLPEAGDVRLQMFDILGRQVKEIALPMQESGLHVVSFDAAGLASGVYFLQLRTAGQVVTRKALLLK